MKPGAGRGSHVERKEQDVFQELGEIVSIVGGNW